MTAAIDAAVAGLAPVCGTRQACAVLGVSQAAWYRRHRQSPGPGPGRSGSGHGSRGR